MMQDRLYAFADALCAHWRAAVVLSAAAALFAGAYAALRLQFNSERNALVNEDLEFNRRFEAYSRNFEGHDYLLAVVEPAGLPEGAGPDLPLRGRMKAFLHRLAGELRSRPDLFPRVYERLDPKALGDLALLYLPLDDLRAVARETEEGLPILRRMADGSGLRGWFTGVREQMEARAAADGAATSEKPASLGFLTGLIDRCATVAESPDPPPALAPLFESSSSSRLDSEGYFFAGEGRLLLLPIVPSTTSEALVQIEGPLGFARQAAARLLPEFPELRAGFTGRPALYADEMATSKHDMLSSNLASVVLVGLLFILTFRSVVRPLLAVGALAVAVALTLAFATFFFGRLNLLSSVFGIVMVAVGINYGIHFLSHYQGGLRLGLDAAGAVRHTFGRAGNGLLIGAATTAAALYSPVFSDFQGLWELGAISGTGILLCLGAMLVAFPACLVALDRKSPAASTPTSSAPVPRAATREPGHAPRPVPYRLFPLAALPVVLLTLAGAAACALFGRHVEFDYNLLHLQSPDVESVVYEWKLIRAENRSSSCASIVRTAEELEPLREKYRARRDVVLGTDALFPEDEAEKRSVLARLHQALAGCEVPEPQGLSLAALKREVARLRQVLRSYVERDERAERLLSPVADGLSRLQARLEAGPADELQARLAAFEYAFTAALAERLAALKSLLRPGPVRPEALPEELRRRYVGGDGSLALIVYPRKNVWEYAEMEEFARTVRSIDPTAVGAPIQLFESHKLFVRAFAQTVALSSVAILALLYADFRSLRRTLVAASPLALGMAFLLGGMRAFGVPFHFANFFAVPILIGSGVDNGVHLVHGYLGEGDASTIGQTYRAIFVSSCTTLLGFGTLFTARHVGLAGLGLLLTVGTGLLLAVSVLFVPAFLAVCARFGWKL
ncbi:MAG: MMPL family transporter [Planctomycetes bacterium]|nr:MMPL family transporter [Planctomycetota bacterium]